MSHSFNKRIFGIKDDSEFNSLALEIFHLQANENEVYKNYINYLKINSLDIKELKDIPFLPIQFFKSQRVITGNKEPQTIFTSSGTSGTGTSRHYLTDLSLYNESFLSSFQAFYGNPDEFYILALLPSYLERSGSSLIFMVNELIKKSQSNISGFYLDEHDKLIENLQHLKKKNDRKILLLGVSFALLDMIENETIDLSNVIIMETGGMKGRKEEITREELHKILSKKMNIPAIHSEYGMTELLSQAYSSGSGIFQSPPWMRILIRDPYDPFQIFSVGRSGGINIIDLANINSCAFIETQDLGKLHGTNQFEVLGRFDRSEIRGCNLLVE
ncbi:MAG: acyltransferase [Bacteroidales bacterium]|nr:acyltransferase [Bacteroidales bacterium]